MGICALCKSKAQLRKSHIIPKYVVKYYKDRASTGYLRHSDNINRRIQDGTKVKLLCEDCENQFSVWENLFKQKVFEQAINEDKSIFSHEHWMLKFAVSISWRNLVFHLPVIDKNIPDDLREYYEGAEKAWRKYLLDETTSIGQFQQHFIFLDIIKNSTISGMPSNMNRYLSSSLDIGMMGYDVLLATYTKMINILIIGIIYSKNLNQFKGTRISSGKSFVGRKNYVIPKSVVWSYCKNGKEITNSKRYSV
ncbi:MAG: hypothetical protein FVQ81_14340 [Candidatus Glassbacteria bacterium]|nr:hypothetical protein [Candidatus Glassbacteria bacterium]